jgi:hypothetical protein
MIMTFVNQPTPIPMISAPSRVAYWLVSSSTTTLPMKIKRIPYAHAFSKHQNFLISSGWYISRASPAQWRTQALDRNHIPNLKEPSFESLNQSTLTRFSVQATTCRAILRTSLSSKKSSVLPFVCQRSRLLGLRPSIDGLARYRWLSEWDRLFCVNAKVGWTWEGT